MSTTSTPAMRNEERTFRRGQEATACLVRALAVPDRSTQLAIARLMIETRKRAADVIALAKCEEAGQETWPEAPDPETVGRNLASWHREGILGGDGDPQPARSVYASALDPV